MQTLDLNITKTQLADMDNYILGKIANIPSSLDVKQSVIEKEHKDLDEDMDRAEADRLKAIEQYESLRIKNEQARGKLIDRKLVEKVFARIQTVDVQEILPIAISFPAEAAGLCGIEDQEIENKMEKLLTEKFYLAFAHKKILVDKFSEELNED